MKRTEIASVSLHCAPDNFPSPGWHQCYAVASAFLCVAATAAGAAVLDVPVANWAHRMVNVPLLMPVFRVMKAPGHFGFTVAIAMALVLWHPARWRAAAFLCLSGIVSGMLYTTVKWCVGRMRPFHGVPPFELHPFAHGIAGFFRSETSHFLLGMSAWRLLPPRLYPFWSHNGCQRSSQPQPLLRQSGSSRTLITFLM